MHIVLLKCPHVQIAFLKFASCDNQTLVGCIPIAAVAVHLNLKSEKLVIHLIRCYSNNIVNFQESTTILNACTKKSGNLLNTSRIHSWIIKQFYFLQFNLAWVTCLPNSFIWPIDRTLPPGQSGSWGSYNNGVLCIPQSSSITGASPSDCLFAYPEPSLGWVLALCRDAVGILNSSSWLGYIQLWYSMHLPNPFTMTRRWYILTLLLDWLPKKGLKNAVNPIIYP